MPLPTLIEVPRTDSAGNPIIGPDGRPVMGTVINPIKQHVRGYWLTPEPRTVTLTAAGTPGAEATLNFDVDNQGHFDWSYILGNSTGAYLLSFFDTGNRHGLSNRMVHNVTIVGSAVRPFRLPEPYFINVGDSTRRIVCKVRNLEAGDNEIELVMYGRRFYHREAPPVIARDIQNRFGDSQRTYSYFLVGVAKVPAEGDPIPPPIPVGGTMLFSFFSEYESDSELHKLMVSSNGDFNFTLSENVGAGRLLMNSPVRGNLGWGNAEFPFFFADPYFLEAQQELVFRVTNLDVVPITVFSTIAGRRIMVNPFK